MNLVNAKLLTTYAASRSSAKKKADDDDEDVQIHVQSSFRFLQDISHAISKDICKVVSATLIKRCNQLWTYMNLYMP